MRLLFLDQFSDLGGAQQALLELLPALRERGWQAQVGMPGTGKLRERAQELGFAVAEVECGPYASGRKSLSDVARFLLGTPRLSRQIRALAEDVDLVYINGPRLLPAASRAGLRAPVVFHSHSFLGPGMMRRLAGSALRRLDAAVIANCQFVADSWTEFVPPERLSVIYNGVGPNQQRAKRNGSTVACIGRIAPEKGQLAFLEAAEQIHRAAPGCRFVIYGAALFAEAGAARYEREVHARAAGLPVQFAGWVGDIQAALSQTDLLLVPSTAAEATTRVIPEAYAAGTPVIAFASGGIPEVVEDGLTGFLVRSAGEMARAAIDLLGDPARQAAMSAAARDCWARRFTLQQYQRDVVAAIERARRPAGPVLPLRRVPDHSHTA